MDIAVSVKNLSKKYQLYDSPQHRLKEALHPFRKKYHHDFWALNDVSFEVKRGETFSKYRDTYQLIDRRHDKH